LFVYTLHLNCSTTKFASCHNRNRDGMMNKKRNRF